MSTFELIISAAIIFLCITAAMALQFYAMQKRRESRYNEEKSKIELDLLRHNVESQIYGLNDRLTKTKSRLNDVFELQMGGNDREIRKSSDDRLEINEFLRSAGIVEEDLSVRQFIFVLTPFHTKYDEVYESIKRVCDKADIRCIRGDEQNFKGDIFSHVIKNIVQSKLVIANLSGRNPNVLYELGIAHALDKATILIAEFLDDLPVDIRSKRFVTYKSEDDLERKLAIELLKVLGKKSITSRQDHLQL